MNIPIRQLKKWIAALDSGEYDRRRRRVWFLDFDWPLPYNEIVEVNRNFGDKTSTTLSYLYDGKGWKFSEIATLLELVYIHKMLE